MTRPNPESTQAGDVAALECRSCGATAHWFALIRGDGEHMTMPLCNREMEALCITCALALDPLREICPCQFCQREVDKLRRLLS